MITGSDFPQTVARADLEIKYSEGLKAAQNDAYRQLIEIIPSASNSKIEVFYGDKPRLRRWKGERQPQKFNEYKLNIVGEEWELTHSWKRSELNRDASGSILKNKVMEFGTAVNLSKEQEFWEYLRNGSSVRGFDKAFLFDFNHRYVTSSGATITAVAAQSNMHLGGSQVDASTIQAERAAFAQVKTDTNRPFGLRLTHVVVQDGSENHKSAMEIANSQFTVETSTVKGTMTNNIFQGSFNIIPTNYGIGASEWFTIAANIPEMKPIKVLSETNNPGFDNMEFGVVGLDTESDNSFARDEVQAGVKGYWGFNPGYWQTIRLRGSSSYAFTPADLENQPVLYANA